MSDFQIFSGATSSPPLIAFSQTTPVVFPLAAFPNSLKSVDFFLAAFAALNEFTNAIWEKFPNNPAMYVAIWNHSDFQLFPRENVDIWNQSDLQLFSGGNVAQLSQRECRLPHS